MKKEFNIDTFCYFNNYLESITSSTHKDDLGRKYKIIKINLINGDKFTKVYTFNLLDNFKSDYNKLKRAFRKRSDFFKF